MTYELAKQLKDAGFLQTGNGQYFSSATIGKMINYGKVVEHQTLTSTEYIYFPTLSELIEACGDGLYEITRVKADLWEAHSYITMGTKGQTPEEAVARLWLALNSKTI